MSAALRQAAEGLLKAFDHWGSIPCKELPEEPDNPAEGKAFLAMLGAVTALRSALAVDAAEEERARAAESVAYAAVIAHYNAALKETADG